MNIVDSHNHIHFRAFGHDREEVLGRAYDGGVTSMLTIGIDPNDCEKALDAAREHKGVFASIGIHPQNADKYGVKEVQNLAVLCNDPCVLAIGETGFDLFRTPESEPRQKDLFAAHIELARERCLPLVIHDRKAHEQTLQVMNDTKAWPIGGVFHCFSGDAQLARIVTGNGFFISIPGVVSFKNAHVLKDVVNRTPLEFLLVETDAPYLTPEPFRGKRNEPLYVIKVVDEIARIKKTSTEEIARVTSENFSRLFLRDACPKLKVRLEG